MLESKIGSHRLRWEVMPIGDEHLRNVCRPGKAPLDLVEPQISAQCPIRHDVRVPRSRPGTADGNTGMKKNRNVASVRDVEPWSDDTRIERTRGVPVTIEPG
jgi:hypothetical protein